MVRHDAPRDQIVAVTMEVGQCRLDYLRAWIMSQGAATHTCVQPDFDLLSALLATLVIWQISQFLFQGVEPFLRQ